jgi:signal transduction histidine kinase
MMVSVTLLGVGQLPAQPVLRVGGYQNPPKIDIDQQGRPVGFFAEVVEAIASDNQWRIEWQRGTWSELMAALEAGALDVMPDVARTEQRAQTFKFNEEVVLSNWSVFYSLPRRRATTALHDLDGGTIALLRDSVQIAELGSVARALQLSFDLVELDSVEAAFRAVDDHLADYALVNQLAGHVISRQFPHLVQSDMVFQPTGLHFAFRPDVAAEVVTRFDASLRRLKDDPQSAYNQALQRWIYTARPQYRAPSVWDRIGPTVLVAALIAASGILLFQHLLRRRTAELRHNIVTLKQREQELVVARNQAESANRAKSEFLAVVNHELRTPLNGVIPPVELLLAECKDPNQRQLLLIIQSSAHHLLRDISQILDLTQLESQVAATRGEWVNLKTFISESIAGYHQLATDKGLQFDTSFSGMDFRLAEVDPVLLRQVIFNVLDNAFKYTARGSVSLDASYTVLESDPTAAVAPTLFPHRGDLRLTVRDTGAGIPAQSRDIIFQPFQQADMSTLRPFGGLGMGLTIAYRAITKLGGRLWLENSDSTGSCFCAVVPLRASSDLTSADTPEPA